MADQTVTPTPTEDPKPLTLSQAISNVETSQNALSSADGALDTANQKLAAAQASQSAAKTADDDAVQQANAALDALIAVATAAKR